MIGDQRRELLAAIAEVAEEPIDCGLEAGEGRIVLIPKRSLLQKRPQPLNQIEIGRLGRQGDQLDAAPLAGQILHNCGRSVVARIVEHDVDGCRARMARRQRLK